MLRGFCLFMFGCLRNGLESWVDVFIIPKSFHAYCSSFNFSFVQMLKLLFAVRHTLWAIILPEYIIRYWWNNANGRNRQENTGWTAKRHDCLIRVGRSCHYRLLATRQDSSIRETRDNSWLSAPVSTKKRMAAELCVCVGEAWKAIKRTCETLNSTLKWLTRCWVLS